MNEIIRAVRVSIAGMVTAALLVGCQNLQPSQDRTYPHGPLSEEPISLAGQWQFELDPQGVGEKDRWFEKDLPKTIELPGSTAENGYGDDISVDTKWTGGIQDKSWFTDPKYEKYRQPGAAKIPFWLTPVKHYVGPAWYQREFLVPENRPRKRVVLFLERPHWETKVWIDDKFVGNANALSTGHEHELGIVSAGRHRLTICVDNTIKINVGSDSHSISDHTQTNWNGIVGKIELRATDTVWIDDVQIYPDIQKKQAKVRVTVKKAGKGRAKGILHLSAESFNSDRVHNAPQMSRNFSVEQQDNVLEMDYQLGEDTLLWDEFSPNLYRLTASIGGKDFADSKTVTFGMREFKTSGTQFTINGRKTFLRGTLECCVFPLTGYPPTDVDAWLRILKVAKSHGLNHLRFHSWCPPEAAFEAADRMGFMYHVECAAWVNGGPTIGDGQDVDKFIYAEGDRILKAYGNHPSFCMLAYGNEPAGKNQRQFLGKLVNYWKSKDRRRVYTSAAGWPIIPQSDYHSTPQPRGHQWGEGLKGRFNSREPATNTDYRATVVQYRVPVVSHEIGQWCAYPNLREIAKYAGVLKAGNFEIFRDSLAEHQMLDQAQDFLMASGKLQAILYKEEIEAALRTRGFAGFQLLDIHDFPGQGTALVGVLDAFWDSKGYIAAQEFHEFCSETVPLLRMRKFLWTADETFTADCEIANFGPAPIDRTVVEWSITCSDGSEVASGHFQPKDLEIGNGQTIGVIQARLAGAPAPSQLVVRVSLRDTPYTNHWPIWVYPEQMKPEPPRNVLIAERMDDKVIKTLEAGGRVLLMPALGSLRSDIPAGFSTIFWNTQWTQRQPPHTLGILCDPNHPALMGFPTQSHSNWQWWDLVTKSKSMVLDDLPAQLRPIVQVIDDWNTNRKLGLVFEAKVEEGRLLLCSIDLRSRMGQRPAARQMLQSLMEYAGSTQFNPQVRCDMAAIQGLFAPAAK